MNAAETLAALLERENAALAARDYGAAGALVAAKHAAAAALGDPDLADDWRATPALAARLDELARENKRLLLAAMRVQREVLDMLARAVRADRRAPGYDASGRMQPRKIDATSLMTRI